MIRNAGNPEINTDFFSTEIWTVLNGGEGFKDMPDLIFRLAVHLRVDVPGCSTSGSAT